MNTIRKRTIEEIKEMIKSGSSFKDVLRAKWMYFTIKRLKEYYKIALEEIKAEKE